MLLALIHEMILYTTISTLPYVRDEIKRLSQRYVDRLEEYSSLLAIDFMSDADTPLRLKRKLKIYVSKCTINYKSLNVTRSDSL